MNSDDKSMSLGILFACTTICTVIFLVSSCVSKDSVIEAEVAKQSTHLQTMCVEKNGTWVTERNNQNYVIAEYCKLN